ncbi:MAG TPA: PIG-L family deacetylase [Verrucomicrobiae bacterium]|nr:PIG-L family deacetylase [Verrucomicrobiae bacterium]
MATPSTLNPATCHRLLLFAPHPDDESLTAGGLVQRVRQNSGIVRVVFITDGSNNPWPQRVLEKRWHIGEVDRARWGARRRGEATNALTKLGVPLSNVRFLGLPDQGLTKILLGGGKELVEELVSEIEQFKPDCLVAPTLSDRHKDHNAFAVLLQMAIDRLSTTQRNFSEFHYVTHMRRKYLPTPDYTFRLSSAERTTKRDAILCHVSQVRLSHRRFLAFAEGDEVFFGKQSPIARSETHPVCLAEVADGALRLELAISETPDEYILHVVSKSGQHTLILPAKTSTCNVLNCASRTIVTQAKFDNEGGLRQIMIPLSALAPGERIFVKLESRSGFYDPSGWREIPALPRKEFLKNKEASSAGVNAYPRVCAILPCYNVATRCGEVLHDVLDYADQVIAIDDGSSDETGSVLRSIAERHPAKVKVITFLQNCGKGVALLAGFKRALEEIPFDVLVAIDADGQHNARDIPRLVEVCVGQKAALVIGERAPCSSTPWRSRVGNGFTSKLFQRLYPVSPRDTQSGFRAMNRELVEVVVKMIKPQRYETELQILMLALDLHKPLSTVPIETIYFDQNRLSHFRPVKDSIRIYWAFLMWHLSVRADNSSLREAAGAN